MLMWISSHVEINAHMKKKERKTDRQTDRLNRRITTMKGMLRRKGKGKWHADMKE